MSLRSLRLMPFWLALCVFAAGCSGSVGGPAPISTPSQLLYTGSALSIPFAGPQYSGVLTVPSGSPVTNDAVLTGSSSSAPANAPVLQLRGRRAAPQGLALAIMAPLVYVQLEFSQKTTVVGLPSFSFATGGSIDPTRGALYIAFLDPTQASPSWQLAVEGPGVVSGNSVAFTGTSSSFTFAAKQIYTFALYQVTPSSTGPIPASLAITGVPGGTAGTPFTGPQSFTVTAKDANGHTIVGAYADPIFLVDSDTSGATTLATSGSDNPPALELLSSSDTATLNYTGLAVAPITITAQSANAMPVTAGFSPTLAPIVYTGPLNAGHPEIDFSAASGTGSTFGFSATELGWTNAPYNKVLTLVPPAACSGILNLATSTLSGVAFTENVAASPVAGTCSAALNDGAGQSLSGGITFTYTTTGLGVQ